MSAGPYTGGFTFRFALFFPFISKLISRNNEEYEWEYIESDEEKELEKKASTNEASQDVKNSTDSMMKKDKKTELHKEACKYLRFQ